MQYTIRSEIIELTETEQNELIRLMRKFQAAVRFSYNRLVEGMSKKQLVPLLQEKFIPNARYCQWAADKAQGTIDSQTELLPLYLREVEAKIEKSRQKLPKIKSEQRRKGVRARIKKLAAKRDGYLKHIQNGTLPPAVFGGKKNAQLLSQGKLSREKWRELRSNSVYSRGQANQRGPNGQQGNANTELRHQDNNLFAMAVRIPTGQGRAKDRWLELTVRAPEYYVADLREWLASGQAYSVDVRRKGPPQGGSSRFFCHISLNLPEYINGYQNGVAGIDVNPQGVAVTITHPDGNYRSSRWFPCPELLDVSDNKRAWIIGNLSGKVVDYISGFGVGVVGTERLKFKNSHDTNKKFNRLSNIFAHRQMLQAIHIRCCKAGLEIREVNPAFTSLIGQVKYAETYGLSVHQAAGLAIARRAMDIRNERIPRKVNVAVFGNNRERSSWRAWGKVSAWMSSVRKDAAGIDVSTKGWSISSYIKFVKAPLSGAERPETFLA